MKVILRIGIIILLFTISCKEGVKLNNKQVYVIKAKDSVLYSYKKNEKENKLELYIDSVSFNSFWKKFKSDIKNDNRKEVVKIIGYPVRAIYPVIFQYSYDCDTIKFIHNQEKYSDTVINIENINEYYDFVFNEVLKKVILKTSIEDLLKKGIINNGGLTFEIYAKDYYSEIECPNDHLLMLHFYKNEEGYWMVSFGGL